MRHINQLKSHDTTKKWSKGGFPAQRAVLQKEFLCPNIVMRNMKNHVKWNQNFYSPHKIHIIYTWCIWTYANDCLMWRASRELRLIMLLVLLVHIIILWDVPVDGVSGGILPSPIPPVMWCQPILSSLNTPQLIPPVYIPDSQALGTCWWGGSNGRWGLIQHQWLLEIQGLIMLSQLYYFHYCFMIAWNLIFSSSLQQ